MSYPAGIGVAASPYAVQFFNPSRKSPQSLYSDLCARYSSLGGSLAPRSTWKDLLTQSIHQIINTLPILPKDKDILICIYSTDANLMGDQTVGSIADGLTAFMAQCDKLKQLVAPRKVNLRLVAIPLLKTNGMVSTSQRIHEQNKFLIFSELQTKQTNVEFEIISNTHYSFDEELRVVLGKLVPMITWKLYLTSDHGIDIIARVQIQPIVLDAVPELVSIQEVELCNVTNRDGIHPLYVDGSAAEVLAAPLHGSINPEESMRMQHNAILVQALAEHMVEHNRILVFRTIHREVFQQTSPFYSYWALVPSASSQSLLPMCVMKLRSRDHLIIPMRSHAQNEPPGPNSGESNEMRREAKEHIDACLTSISGTPPPFNAWSYTSGTLQCEMEDLMHQQCSFSEGNAIGAGGLTTVSHGTVEKSMPTMSSFKSAASIDNQSKSLVMESKKQTLHVSLSPVTCHMIGLIDFANSVLIKVVDLLEDGESPNHGKITTPSAASSTNLEVGAVGGSGRATAGRSVRRSSGRGGGGRLGISIATSAGRSARSAQQSKGTPNENPQTLQQPTSKPGENLPLSSTSNLSNRVGPGRLKRKFGSSTLADRDDDDDAFPHF
eukprot:scaffold4347_cov269-Ochromonas_danica.AAC.10